MSGLRRWSILRRAMVWGGGPPEWVAKWRTAEDKGRGPPARCQPSTSSLSVVTRGFTTDRVGPDWTPETMRSELPELRRVIEECGDEDFDKFMAGTVKEVLLSEGYTSRQLEEAMTMGTVQTAFQRGLDEMVQQGMEEGREEGQTRILQRQVTRRFGPETSSELSRLLVRFSNPEGIARAADAILDCDSGEEFLARVRDELTACPDRP